MRESGELCEGPKLGKHRARSDPPESCHFSPLDIDDRPFPQEPRYQGEMIGMGMGDEEIAFRRLHVDAAQALFHRPHTQVEVHPGVDDETSMLPLYYVDIDRIEKG